MYEPSDIEEWGLPCLIISLLLIGYCLWELFTLRKNLHKHKCKCVGCFIRNGYEYRSLRGKEK